MTVAPQAGSGSGRGELPRKGYGKIEGTLWRHLTQEMRHTTSFALRSTQNLMVGTYYDYQIITSLYL